MKRWLWIIVLVAVAVGGIGWGLRQQPVPVEAAEATRGPLQVTVTEEGKTRLQSRYIVSAPTGGFMRRLQWEVGDRIRSGQTVTVLSPMGATLLDTRSRDQGEARVRAAEAARDVVASEIKTAEEGLRAAEVDLAYWQRQMEREEPLVRSGDRPAQRVDEIATNISRAQSNVSAAETAIATVRQQVMRAEAEVEAARAALGPAVPQQRTGGEAVAVVAPTGGRVIRLIQESEGAVTPGQPLIEIGDANAIEVEVELLSQDAVLVMPGTRVVLSGWGGDSELEARVRVVEPGGFTKVSALGVEEQRVRVIADITSPDDMWDRLGDGYRVEAGFVLWEGEGVLQVPANALFRTDDSWSVFVIEENVARLRQVELGHRTGLTAEILSGLEEGDVVVAHPDETVEDGFPVAVS